MDGFAVRSAEGRGSFLCPAAATAGERRRPLEEGRALGPGVALVALAGLEVPKMGAELGRKNAGHEDTPVPEGVAGMMYDGCFSK